MIPSLTMNQILEMGLCFKFYSYFLVYLCFNSPCAETFVKLNCEKSVTGVFNEDTILPCRMDTTELMTLRVTKLHEIGGDEVVFTFNSSENGSEVRGQIKLRRQDSKDVSLIIQKTQASNNGTYQFYVETDHGYDTKSISLMFKAPYTVPQISKKDQGGEKGLVCTTVGYPQPQLYWKTENETNLTHYDTIGQTNDELYNITSYIPVAEDWCLINYSCFVCMENNCTSKELECTKAEPISGQPQEKDRAGCRDRVGVFLILGFLMLLIFTAFFYGKKEFYRAYIRRQSESATEDLVDDEEN
ncbi:butyrophilin subfamily 1 member A1-like isoform X2 [Pristis pectinata]|uniref:butyrophilin subfamily 1 member A1-like isoform X2 n=1 Tax=Pristis pectinata TaxID=685728 RepID=UPI00223E19B1|nr:butyrophilin subfamily 1 member A1-like isoform X2 [Pristis pectinata]